MMPNQYSSSSYPALPAADRDLVRIATDFRDGILEGRPSAGMCFAICSPLATLLETEGVKAELVEGAVDDGNHVWLRLPDGRVLDPTADQYGGPLVYLGPPLAIHSEAQPCREGRLSAVGADLVRAAIEWRRSPKGRERNNAQRRFERRMAKARNGDPLASLGLHVEVVGMADAVIRGDVCLDGDRLELTEQGARTLEQRRVDVVPSGEALGAVGGRL